MPFLILGFVLLSISFPFAISYFIDARLHEGVNMFTRRRVLRQGVAASARVLSSTMLMKPTGSKFSAAYSIIYEVTPPGAAPFRAKGIEVMFFSEHDANRLREGETVNVRFDSASQTVVLVRVDAKQAQRDKEAALRAKEEALLRGRSDR
jgi:hypothetical protein